MDTVGERLRWAIETFGPRPRGRPEGPGSIRQFAERMEGRKELRGKGASYQMIHRYLPKPDNPEPTVPGEQFLKAAAQVFSKSGRVRFRWEWLARGDGEPTMADELQAQQHRTLSDVQRTALGETADRVGQSVVAELFGGELPAEVAAWDTSFPALLTLWRTRRIARFRTKESGVLPTDEEVARSVGRALAAPLEELGVPVRSLTEHQLQNYILSAVAALTPVAHLTTKKGETDG